MNKIRRILKKTLPILFLVVTLVSCSNLLETLETVKIEYITEHGTAPKNKTLKHSSLLTKEDLPNLSEKGQVFNGWFIGKDKIEVGYKVIQNITLKANWKSLSDDSNSNDENDETKYLEITDLSVKQEKDGVILTWKDPISTDLDKVSVSYEGNNNAVEIVKGIEKVQFTGLTYGKEYKFTVKSVYKDGQVSKGVSISYTLTKESTDDVIVLPPNTDGTNGSKNTYVLFGDFPQSIKASDVTILEPNKPNEKSYYMGSDGYQYAKVKANPISEKYNFSDGSSITKGEEYYFKVEPIKWRIINQDETNYYLLTENIMIGLPFYLGSGTANHNYSDCNYEYSTLRAYLNGLDGTSYNVSNYKDKGFIDFAFSKGVTDKILKMEVTNDINSTRDYHRHLPQSTHTCNNTFDKVFVLSATGVTNPNSGFGEYKYELHSRQKVISDYAIAIGSPKAWWTRSSCYNNPSRASYVTAQGKYNNLGYYVSNVLGVVPGIVLPKNLIKIN